MCHMCPHWSYVPKKEKKNRYSAIKKKKKNQEDASKKKKKMHQFQLSLFQIQFIQNTYLELPPNFQTFIPQSLLTA